ncbi:hypothetical protein SAMN05444368_0462 [Acetomicrobium flavidum]|uniref:Uncharacterized protein n=1 Tax=Acetomicrobium flavidum TaxID=49896 RepID=A0ABY1JBF2_9BACT|nr:hypothetical protein SAMN05444368_0462 [Acetomicrobium flavidum]
MEEDSSKLVVLNEKSTVVDSLRALYRTTFKVAKLTIEGRPCFITKDELVAALERGLGNMPLDQVLSLDSSRSSKACADCEMMPFPLLKLEDGVLQANQAAKDLMGPGIIETVELSDFDCTLLELESGETVSIEPLGYGYFTARRLNEEEVRRIFETARWAAIGKALWYHLETQGMTLTLETKRRRGYIPLVLDGVEFGYLACRKPKKTRTTTKKADGDDTSIS